MLRHGDKKDKVMLERAFNICSDLGEVAELYLAGRNLEEFSPEPFKPIRPALAERLPNAEEIIQKLCFEPEEKIRKAEEKEAEEDRKAEAKPSRARRRQMLRKENRDTH